MKTLVSGLTVGEVALSIEKIVTVRPVDVLRVVVEAMSAKRLGIACVVDGDGHLAGVITDGDIRRVLLNTHKPMAALFADDIQEFMTRGPKTVNLETTLIDAVSLMESADVLDLPVVDGEGVLVGLLHVHTAFHYLLNQ